MDEKNLLKDAFKIFGWEIEYFLTESSDLLDAAMLRYNRLTNIVDKVNIKILISDDIKDVKNFNAKILKHTFPENKKPNCNDIIYLPGAKKLYYVENLLEEEENVYNVEFSQYEIKFKING